MSDLTVTFNEQTQATLQKAAEAFGLKGGIHSALSLATALLEIATEANKEGKDFATIKRIRAGTTPTVDMHDILDFKSVKEKENGSVNITVFVPKPGF